MSVARAREPGKREEVRAQPTGCRRSEEEVVSTLDAYRGEESPRGSAVDMSTTKERPRSTCGGGRGDVYPRSNQSAGSRMPSGSGAAAAAARWNVNRREEMRGDNDSLQAAVGDLEYGPGIVDRLKSRFIHLTLRDNDKPRLRRACSLENLVEDGVFQAIDCSKGDRSIVRRNRAKYDLSSCGKNNFKKAQSMETLVIKKNAVGINSDPRSILVNENVVIVEKVDHEPESAEEYPKRDTVKTYKRMFEPAESKQMHRRKPPVLRASAKSSCNKTAAVKPSAIVQQTQPSTNGETANKQVKQAKPEQSVVFDFRGKSTKPNVTLQPTPFGCKPVQKSVKKFYRLFDGKEGLPNGAEIWDEEEDDDDDVDGSQADLPHPSGITFRGENVKVGRGSLLLTRNKNLRIKFDDKVTSIHEYPSESSMLENDRIEQNDTSPLGLTGLASYTPSVLKSSEAYHLGYPRATQTEVPENKQEEVEIEATEELKPADPDSTSSWSSSTTTDLLF